MEYDAIILELLTRIKKLEDDVALLKQERGGDMGERRGPGPGPGPRPPHRPEGRPGGPARTRMTEEMIDLCYRYGKRVHGGESAQLLADEVAMETGMNRSSAFMYLCAVNCLLSGTVFKRAISTRALQKYFDNIFEEYGREGLKLALEATRKNVDYRRECGLPAGFIEEVCDRNAQRL